MQCDQVVNIYDNLPFELDSPREKLESLFLRVVQEARRSRQGSSGAAEGRRSGFLADGVDADGERGPDDVIDRLTAVEPAEHGQEEDAPVEEHPVPVVEEEDNSVIDDLIQE